MYLREGSTAEGTKECFSQSCFVFRLSQADDLIVELQIPGTACDKFYLKFNGYNPVGFSQNRRVMNVAEHWPGNVGMALWVRLTLALQS